MSENQYGIRMFNYQGGSIFAYNNGARTQLDYKKSMLSNSLFLDWIKDNGLKLWKQTYTRDIIGVSFDYGTRSYDEEVKHLQKMLSEHQDDTNYCNKIKELLQYAHTHKDCFVKMSKEDIRRKFYTEGIDITYTSKNKAGDITKTETVHYVYCFRSVGKAKKGSAIFIREKLYKRTINFLRMGIKLPKRNAPIVEVSAYAPLIASSIVGTVEISPKNILTIKDIDSLFSTNVISVETDENKKCICKHIKDYQVANTMFDGQALIDTSIFPSWAEGYILLRNHFFKAAAFHTNIQQFFMDYFGDNYDTAKLKDMWGNEYYAKDIKLITTENAFKWVKNKEFNIDYDIWSKWVSETTNNKFGIVKTVHESKLGNVQRMSYQMINSLSYEIMPEVTSVNNNYINLLKTDNEVFLDYLSKNYNFANDYEVLVALCRNNPEFTQSEYFRERKYRIMQTYLLNYRSGHVNQCGDNLVLCGSPYAMLLASVGEDVEKDTTLRQEDGSIQCYAERFEDNIYLAGFRSPHNSCNNILYLHNVYSDEMKKYFNLGNLIMAVNVNHSDIQDRGNGLDFDSDSAYVTCQIDIVNHAAECYKKFPTIVNNIHKEKKSYNNTLADFAEMDISLAQSQADIGQSSNIAQVLLSYSHTWNDEKYKDWVCILSVLAQCAIDGAKRRFDVDTTAEIKRIKKEADIKNIGYPKFWKYVNPNAHVKINKNIVCPMNYLCEQTFPNTNSRKNTLPMQYFFEKYPLDNNRKKCKKVEELIKKYNIDLTNYNISYNEDSFNREADYLLIRADFEELIFDIKELYISKTYLGLFSWLIDRAFCISPQMIRNSNTNLSKINDNKVLLMKTLYAISPNNFLKIWSKSLKNWDT